MQIPVEGFMYPNEVELQWSVLIVLYPFITGLVAGAFILASLERVFRVEAVKPTYRLALLTALAFLLVAPLPLQLHLGHPERSLRDVSDAAPLLRHGHVRIRLSLVPDGRAAVGDLARLPPRHCPEIPDHNRRHAPDLPRAHPRLQQPQCTLPAHRRAGSVISLP